jgi:flagellar motor protein MotB
MTAAINNESLPGSVAVDVHNRFQAPPRATLRMALPFVAIVLIAGMLGACRPPPVKPVVVDHAAEQRAALNALGFAAGDDGWLLNLPDPIWFDLEKDALKPNMQQSIATTAAGLLKANVRKLRIEGHTDNSGPREYNIALSQRRAETVAREFISPALPAATSSMSAWGRIIRCTRTTRAKTAPRTAAWSSLFRPRRSSSNAVSASADALVSCAL